MKLTSATQTPENTIIRLFQDRPFPEPEILPTSALTTNSPDEKNTALFFLNRGSSGCGWRRRREGCGNSDATTARPQPATGEYAGRRYKELRRQIDVQIAPANTWSELGLSGRNASDNQLAARRRSTFCGKCPHCAGKCPHCAGKCRTKSGIPKNAIASWKGDACVLVAKASLYSKLKEK